MLSAGLSVGTFRLLNVGEQLRTEQTRCGLHRFERRHLGEELAAVSPYDLHGGNLAGLLTEVQVR